MLSSWRLSSTNLKVPPKFTKYLFSKLWYRGELILFFVLCKLAFKMSAYTFKISNNDFAKILLLWTHNFNIRLKIYEFSKIQRSELINYNPDLISTVKNRCTRKFWKQVYAGYIAFEHSMRAGPGKEFVWFLYISLRELGLQIDQ